MTLVINDIVIENSIEVLGVDVTTSLSNLNTSTTNLNNHIANIANPHAVTKSQVGLSNVDNTSDANKPISTATQTDLNLKAPIASPTFTGTVLGITSAMVGLGNVDNTSDASKPISTATQTDLNLKAPIASPTFTGTATTPAIIVSSETASRVAIIDASKNVKSADTSIYPNLTELAYAKGVTSAIQTQLNGKYFNMYFPMTALAAPGDSTNYHINQSVSSTATTDTARTFKFDTARTLKQVLFNIQQTTNASNETVTVYLRNVTLATDVAVLTFTSDFGASSCTSFVSAVLTESVNASDRYTWRITTPAWGTNPAQWVFAITASLI